MSGSSLQPQALCSVSSIYEQFITLTSVLSGSSLPPQALLKGGASVDAADYDGMSPIHFAARKRGGEACVAMLLNAGETYEGV